MKVISRKIVRKAIEMIKRIADIGKDEDDEESEDEDDETGDELDDKE